MYVVDCDSVMNRMLEQRANVKFCLQLGKSVTETWSMIRQAYSDEVMGYMQCFKWHGVRVRVKSKRISLEDDKLSGRPATCVIPGNVEKTNKLLHEDHQRTINIIADVVGLSLHTILMSELTMWRVTAKFVLHPLTTEQKKHCIKICQDNCQHATDNPSFMSGMISGDESWVYEHNPETK